MLLQASRGRTLVLAAALCAVVALAAFASGRTQRADAAFHFADIDEVMFGVTSAGANVQYVEINMLTGGQNITTNSHLSAWNADGSFNSILLIVPGDVQSGTNRRWIMATPDFAAAAGITPDFTFPSVTLQATGMICWGAPGLVPPDPATWNETMPTNYVDCVPYGGYSAANIRFGPATPDGLGDGVRSLTRVDKTLQTVDDFELLCPTPQNNANLIGSFGACANGDLDGDGVNDLNDNCVEVANAGQEDGDADFLGDACEAAEGTGIADPDTDDDSCEDGRELRTLLFSPAKGGDRDPLSPHDFYSVPVPALTMSSPGGTRDEVVGIPDVLAVLVYSGTANDAPPNGNGVDYDSDLNGNTIEDGAEYDRSPSANMAKPWRSGAPNGSVGIPDALIALAQSGHNCAAPP